jgi:dihydrodipicolinate synthase/N-acetylneuraminate lyase
MVGMALTLAAVVTPLRDGGAALDEDAFRELLSFLGAGGVDGIFALGTTGEGILLSVLERQRALELFIEANTSGMRIIVHSGAQTTADTVALARHAAEAGADGAAVIPPPYFVLDDAALFEHLAAAARACEPIPFYAYEFAPRSGYPIRMSVVDRLRNEVPSFAGMKVSDARFEDVEPYLGNGFDVFIGSEPLIARGLERGAAGTVSGLASAFPELIVEQVRAPTEEGTARIAELRDRIERMPFVPAVKHVLARRGLKIREDVRAPLRTLTTEEKAALEETIERFAPAGL